MKNGIKIMRLSLIVIIGLIALAIFISSLFERADLNLLYDYFLWFPLCTVILCMPTFLFNLKEMKFSKGVGSKKLTTTYQKNETGILDDDLIKTLDISGSENKISNLLWVSNIFFGVVLIFWALILFNESIGDSDDDLIYKTLQYAFLLGISGLGFSIIKDGWKVTIFFKERAV